MKKRQIKTKKRVADFGEVYTDIEQVKAMLDLIPDDNMEIGTTYLEPAMGNGNFLEEILARKLRKVISEAKSTQDVRLNILRSIASIYGVDIQEDNVIEARDRMTAYLDSKLLELYGLPMDRQLSAAVRKILAKNFICGDTLECTASTGDPLVFCEWDIKDNGRIVCKEFRYDDMLANNGSSTKYIDIHRYSWLVPKEKSNIA